MQISSLRISESNAARTNGLRYPVLKEQEDYNRE